MDRQKRGAARKGENEKLVYYLVLDLRVLKFSIRCRYGVLALLSSLGIGAEWEVGAAVTNTVGAQLVLRTFQALYWLLSLTPHNDCPLTYKMRLKYQSRWIDRRPPCRSDLPCSMPLLLLV